MKKFPESSLSTKTKNYRSTEQSALDCDGDIPYFFLNTRIKCGRSLKPTEKQISDTCFCESFNSSQAVFRRYYVTNCEKVIPLLRLKNVQNAERFIPMCAAMSSRVMV